MKKRILIIGLTERMGGVETFIYNTTQFSDKTKYEYDYLVHGANNCVFQDQINDFYDNSKHIYFIRKYKSNPIGCMIDLIKFYWENGSKYDYVHLQTGATSEVLYVFPYCLFYHFKVISHSHNGNGYNRGINAAFRPIVNMISKKRLACSMVAADWLFGKKGCTAQIINNGIDTTKFIFSEENRNLIRIQYGIEKELVVGHIGRFSEQKNHLFMLDIFNEVVKSFPTAKLMLVGEGERHNEVQNNVRKLGLEENVLFCGKQLDTAAYYSAFDVFLMPSLYEGLPIVGIEAQASGLPCVFSSTISKQICITENASIMSLEQDAKKWAANILETRATDNRSEYCKRMSEKGYDIHKTTEILEKVYEV